MKLSQKNEWIVVGILIVYIAFVQPIPAIQDALSSSIGKAIALGAIVYVWKYVSAIVSILLAVAFVRCISTGRVWEMFSGAETSCTCEQPDKYTWDGSAKKCKDKDGKVGAVKSCVCTSGYAWDGGEKGTHQCVPVSGEQPPLPLLSTNPVAEAIGSKATETAAPAISGLPITSSAPITTPGAAAEMAAGAVPSSLAGGVQPGITSSTPAGV